MKKIFLFLSGLLIFVCALNQAKSQGDPLPQVQEPPIQVQLPSEPAQPPPAQVQESIPQAQQPSVETQKAPRHFFFFKRNELGAKFRKERGELLDKQRKEKQEIRERYKKEKEEAKKKFEEEKIKQEALNKKAIELGKKKEQTVLGKVKEREDIIKKAELSNSSVQIVTNENDPLYIVKAEVLDTKTKFLKIKNVEFKYRVELQNQTPKIINSVLLVWERKIAFLETQTISKETKVSKPIIPYEKRVVEYNDLDSKREGEIYTLKIAKVIFEDGTQWANPAKVSYQH